MQNRIKYMANHDQKRLSQLGATDIEISEFKKWPLPLHHEKFRIFGILLCSITLMTIGFRMSANNNKVMVQTINYSSNNDCKIPSDSYSTYCNVTMTIDQKIEAPIHVYYHITKFWQNHFIFVRSMSEDQYYGTDFYEVESCEGNKFGGKLTNGANGGTLVPCGLQGWSHFNDEISLTIKDAANQETCSSNCLDYSDIALNVDKDRFESVNLTQNPDLTSIASSYNGSDGTLIRGVVDIPDLHNESLMVWLRYGATSSFKKIHSRIPQTLYKGDKLTFHINNQFDTHLFGGTKSLILSQAKIFGGKHEFLSIIFILSGILPFFIVVGIIIAHVYLSKKNRQDIW